MSGGQIRDTITDWRRALGNWSATSRNGEAGTVRPDCDALAQQIGDLPAEHPEIAEPVISIVVERGHDSCVLKIVGELDIASCAGVTRKCVEGHARTVIVDLTNLTFLDCGGYRAFVAARTELERQHRRLEIVGAVGEPRHLLDLFHQLGQGAPPLSVAVPD